MPTQSQANDHTCKVRIGGAAAWLQCSTQFSAQQEGEQSKPSPTTKMTTTSATRPMTRLSMLGACHHASVESPRLQEEHKGVRRFNSSKERVCVKQFSAVYFVAGYCTGCYGRSCE